MKKMIVFLALTVLCAVESHGESYCKDCLVLDTDNTERGGIVQVYRNNTLCGLAKNITKSFLVIDVKGSFPKYTSAVSFGRKIKVTEKYNKRGSAILVYFDENELEVKTEEWQPCGSHSEIGNE